MKNPLGHEHDRRRFWKMLVRFSSLSCLGSWSLDKDQGQGKVTSP